MARLQDDRLPDAKALIDAVDEPSLLVANGIVIAANAAARRLLGEKIEGGEVRAAIRHPAAIDHILAGRGADVEVSAIDGADRQWLLAIRPAGDGTLLVRLTDSSALRAAEKMRVDFVANASHELRTPLATLVGYAETMREHGAEIDRDTGDRFIGIIYDEARRMQRLVEDLISLSRIEGERFSPPGDSIDIEALASEAAANWRALAEERGSTVRIEAEDELPPMTGDRNQLLQLIDNLVGNSLRYGRSGTPVDIAIRRDGRMIRVTVADEGEGIPAKHLPRITERFYRVDKARSRDSGGTGLGLAIVKHIVERHRGMLEIESVVGQGTRVHVALPCQAGQLS